MSLLSCPPALLASAITAVVLSRYPVAIMRTKCGKKVLLHDFGLPPPCKRDLRSSGVLHSVDLDFVTYVRNALLDTSIWDQQVVTKRR